MDHQPSDSRPPSKIVRSAARALDIIELLADRRNGLTLSQIGEALEIPVSTVHGLVATLVSRGFVVREEHSLLYRLGPKIPHLSAAYRDQHDIISLADPIMAEIRDQVHETSSLSVLNDGVIVFIHKQPASDMVMVVNPVGTKLLAHATGSGKALLAHLPEVEIDRIYPEETLPKLTDATTCTKTELKRTLETVRRLGYAHDEQESQTGIWAVAAAVRDARGKPVAALSIVAPLFRVQTKNYREWPGLVVDGANRISRLLGYQGASEQRIV